MQPPQGGPYGSQSAPPGPFGAPPAPYAAYGGPSNPYGGPPPPPQKGGGAFVAAIVVGAVVFLLFIAGVVGALVFGLRARGPSGGTGALAWADADSPVPVSSDDPMRGEREALITLVVFSDFQCPFCKRLEPTLDDVRARYGNDVRLIWKNEPLAFHAQARPAAEAARAVFVLKGDNGFWQFHDQAFANQAALDLTHFEMWAKGAGVDGAKFRGQLSDRSVANKIDEDHRLATSLSVSSTPATFVNGVLLSGAVGLPTFQRVIDDELPKARAKLASGTKPDRLYVERSRENFGKAPPIALPPVVPPYVPPPAPTAETVYKVPIGMSPVLGPPLAKVTIVEFSDFQCPFCARAAPTLDRIKGAYAGDVRFVWKNQPLPFHLRAEPAAEFAMEAFEQKGAATFWEIHDALFANNRNLEDVDFLSLARRFGVSEKGAVNAIRTKKHADKIGADQALAKSVGANGTPTFFINGRKLSGAQPFESFQRIILQELTIADKALATGVSRAGLYEHLLGRGTVDPKDGSKVSPDFQ